MRDHPTPPAITTNAKRDQPEQADNSPLNCNAIVIPLNCLVNQLLGIFNMQGFATL
jgi:hypothetical protein